MSWHWNFHTTAQFVIACKLGAKQCILEKHNYHLIFCTFESSFMYQCHSNATSSWSSVRDFCESWQLFCPDNEMGAMPFKLFKGYRRPHYIEYRRWKYTLEKQPFTYIDLHSVFLLLGIKQLVMWHISLREVIVDQTLPPKITLRIQCNYHRTTFKL